MLRTSTLGKHIGLLLASCAAATSCGIIDSQSCTEIGCRDGASIQLLTADGSQRSYVVTLLVDGKEVTCTTPSVSGPTGSASEPCSSSDVTIDHEPLTDCTETRTADAISQSCTPNGKFAQTIHIQGTPSRVVVSLTEPMDAFHERTFELLYETSTPNGPECGPVCHQANVAWQVQ